MSSIESFFAYARERHAIYLRRKTMTEGAYTLDPILGVYRFTNVFRELDRTTIWYRENVREKMPLEQMLLATVVFRWFNRITTGEAIFAQPGVLSGKTVWELMDWSIERDGTGRWLQEIRNSILTYCGSGPYVTGAYIIKTPDGYNKLDGVLRCIEWFMEQEHWIGRVGDIHGAEPNQLGWQEVTRVMTDHAGSITLESVWDWLRQFPFLGDFMAYEIVTDLRWSLLSQAPDIMTWANPGPGATRGLGRVFAEGNKDHWNQHRDKEKLIHGMMGLLRHSQDAGFWPQQRGPDSWDDLSGGSSSPIWGEVCAPLVYTGQMKASELWPAWEMRDVEHTLCEFDKYERVRCGEGTPRGRFR